MRIRLMVAAALTLLAALAAASPASAAPGNGANVVNESDCVTDFFGTFCFDNKYVVNDTQTPSGNTSFVANGRTSYEFTGSGPYAGCNSSGSDKFHFHYLLKDGELHEQSNRSGGEFSFDCFGFNQKCTYKVHGHYANGKFQFNRVEFDCTQP